MPRIDPKDFDVIGLVRTVRRRAGFSQRQLADAAGIAPSTVGRIESGRLVPSIGTLRGILQAAGLDLVAVDQAGRIARPMLDDRDDLRDGAERRYPSHLDTILDPRSGDWWGDRYGLARPPETFYRDRQRRDAERARSRWEVRVKQMRHVPLPSINGRQFYGLRPPPWVWPGEDPPVGESG